MISVITVVYNDKYGLARTYESLKLQVYNLFEWIVVDGGSTDGTVEFLKTCNQVYLQWISEKDRGIYDAMTKGALMARGKDLLFLNAGDEVQPGAISTFACARTESDANSLVVADTVVIDQSGSSRVWQAEPHLVSRFMPFCHQAILIPKYVYRQMNGYSLVYRLSADFDFFLRCWLRGFRFLHLQQPLVIYYRGGLSDQKILHCRLEIIRSLWLRKSPDRLLGTIIILRELAYHYLPSSISSFLRITKLAILSAIQRICLSLR